MKRVITCIIAAVMLMTSCAHADSVQSTTHRVYATFAPVFALTEGLFRGIDDFSVHQLVQPQQDCIRLYELSDWDILQLSTSEICVIWGQGLESFSDTLTQAESGPAVISIANEPSEYVSEFDLADYDYYEHYSGSNPNSYMSLEQMKAACDALYDTLIVLYPDYTDRLSLNHDRMASLFNETADKIKDIDCKSDSTVAALFEGAPYMLEELGITWQYVYPREPASDVTGEDLTELMNAFDSSGIQTAVIERQAPMALKNALESAGIQLKQVSTLITLDEPTLEEYLDILIENAYVVPN